MDLLVVKGFKDGSWQRQTGINSSIYATLVCNNLPLQMLMIPMSLFTSILMDIAEKTIPKTSAVPKRFNKPWFSDICKDAIKERNRALERFKLEPTEGNLNAYRVARAKARKYVRLSKKTSWRNYISKLNSQASVKSVWNRIRKIKGKESTNSIRHLSVNDRDVT